MEASVGSGLALAIVIVAAILCVRFVRARARSRVASDAANAPDTRRFLIVGSGEAARSLARAMRTKDPRRFTIVGCVDTPGAPRHGRGSLVRLGTIDGLGEIVDRHRIDEVLVAIPFAPPEVVANVERCCSGRGRPVVARVVPGALEYVGAASRATIVGDATLCERVLGRASRPLDIAEARAYVEHRVVLVTGAGGSIGSEICRRLVALDPARLILLGHGENSLFGIRNELRDRYGFHRVTIALADITDPDRIREAFRIGRPQLVFHAAAHKHVPITEANIAETCRNNVIGTDNVAMAAAAFGVEKFVMVSTDKAVEPTSVLGSTKRVAELICQSLKDRSGTEFVSVRFGNVLGSRGSVIPVFLDQIRRGGPIEITHRGMERYFMTIPEAASLIVGTARIARDGHVCILNMGEPIRIVTLAERLIELSGLVPHRDIAIVETGIRPGEKLTEALFTRDESANATHFDRFSLATQMRVPYETLAAELERMRDAIALGREDRLRAQLRRITACDGPTSITHESEPVAAIAS